MKCWILLIAVILACMAWTQGPDVPRLGWLRDENGGLRPLAGVAGNFIPGETRLTGAVSAASSGHWTVAKTGSELLVFDRRGDETARFATRSGPAVLGFSQEGDPAGAYLPGENRLLLWKEGRFEAASWQANRDEQVVAIAGPTADTVSMLVRREEAIWRVDRDVADGRVRLERLLPGAGAPALIRPDGTVFYSDGPILACRTADAAEQKVELPGQVLELSEVGEGLVHARTARGDFALLFLGAEPRVFELPGGKP